VNQEFHKDLTKSGQEFHQSDTVSRQASSIFKIEDRN
jgi:hypothetical protein